MLEMIINPKKAERHPWEMFFVGLVYATLSVGLVRWIFGSDPVLSRYSGILLVTFTVMFSMPFVYYTIRLEEKKALTGLKTIPLLMEHKRALMVFMWLFLGFVVAFSFWYIVLPNHESFRAQIETFCMINQPTTFKNCVDNYGLQSQNSITGFATSTDRFFAIFTNNMYVLAFTLIFSLIFGAGVIFILAWNASVIAAAVGIFANESVSRIPLGVLTYTAHGVPEIASYFIVALAGGMISIAAIRYRAGAEGFWEVLQDSLSLVFISVVVLFLAAMIEVFITPVLF
jgi:uncharacterized membrane protein SpoIIM required for sporulation